MRGSRFAVEPDHSGVYRGIKVGQHRPDFIVENAVVVELKSCRHWYDPVFAAQVLTYLRVTGLRVGLLINFNAPIMRDRNQAIRLV